VGSLEPDVPRALGSFRDALLTNAAPGRAKTGRRKRWLRPLFESVNQDGAEFTSP